MRTKKEGVLDKMNTQAQAWAEDLAKAAGVPYACSRGHVFFTGWKPAKNGLMEGTSTDWSAGLVGQWLDYRDPDRNKNCYVNLPGMQGGFYRLGETFTIGEERVTLGQNGIQKMLKEGLRRLLILKGDQ